MENVAKAMREKLEGYREKNPCDRCGSSSYAITSVCSCSCGNTWPAPVLPDPSPSDTQKLIAEARAANTFTYATRIGGVHMATGAYLALLNSRDAALKQVEDLKADQRKQASELETQDNEIMMLTTKLEKAEKLIGIAADALNECRAQGKSMPGEYDTFLEAHAEYTQGACLKELGEG